MRARADVWPELAIPNWSESAETLHLWSQLVGKTKVALAAPMNHYWHVALEVSARGLHTTPLPSGDGRAFDVELDLVAQRLVIVVSDGTFQAFPLADGTLAEFYEHYTQALGNLGINLVLHPATVELPERIQLDTDRTFRRYDADWGNRFFRALVQVDRLFKVFRGRFLGKASPVQFYWGSFDLDVNLYSGRRAPPHPGSAPGLPSTVMRDTYSHEVMSVGFWPGDARYREAAFFAACYPEPEGFARASVLPDFARYELNLSQFVLPYAAVRAADNPDAMLMAFCESTYSVAAELARWPREELELEPSREVIRTGDLVSAEQTQ